MYDPERENMEHPAAPKGATQTSATRVGAADGEQLLSLRDVLRTVWKRLWVVVLVALVFVGAAVGLSLLQTPVYEASAKVLVSQELGGDAQAGNLASNVEGLQQIVQTVIVQIEIRPVAEEVIRRLGLQASPEGILENLTVEQIETTQVIQLSYSDTDPERAQQAVNSISEVASERVSEVRAGASDITATVVEPAVVPGAPVSPDPVRNGLLALGLGLMLGLGLVFLLEYLDDSWRSPEEVEQFSGVPTFGVIPKFEVAKVKKRKG